MLAVVGDVGGWHVGEMQDGVSGWFRPYVHVGLAVSKEDEEKWCKVFELRALSCNDKGTVVERGGMGYISIYVGVTSALVSIGYAFRSGWCLATDARA